MTAARARWYPAAMHATPASESPAPLRVAHVVDVLALAGMEYGVVKLVNRLDAARVRSMIVCMRHRRDDVSTLLSPDVPVFEMRKASGRNWRVILRLADLFRAERVDAVHSHNWSTFLYTVCAARLARVPIVIHGEHGKDDTLRHPKRELGSRILAMGVDCVCAVSRDLAAEVAREWKVPSDRIRWIPNGVDLEAFGGDDRSPGLRGELGLAPDDLVVTNIGGFRGVKDHATLLRAFARVHGAEPRARLLLIGQGSAENPKGGLDREAADLGVAAAVRFAGVRTDIPRLMRTTDVYVNSSRYEGMSNTILEAMAAGRPVVATAVGGTPDLVVDGETGHLVPSGDPDAMARRILELLKDVSRRAEMGRAGRARMEAVHSMPGMVRAYAALYAELAARRVPRFRAAPRSVPPPSRG
ncbi:MAG TPA: glycosyltransferase [Candidatus Eisenbacteria bacterium]|nr:glycosyltransferase [Candidatus Eisenbacteria bacterium]